eukprot:6202298-Pleurochrysis_carterae.AAC.2
MPCAAAALRLLNDAVRSATAASGATLRGISLGNKRAAKSVRQAVNRKVAARAGTGLRFLTVAWPVTLRTFTVTAALL